MQDVCVAGVSSIPDGEQFPRAWVVIANSNLDKQAASLEIDYAVKHHLSKQKWLTGGIEFVDEASRFRVFCAMLLADYRLL